MPIRMPSRPLSLATEPSAPPTVTPPAFFAQRSAIGAFPSLPRVPAKVPSPNLCRHPSSCNANRWSVGPDQFDPGNALAYLVEDQPDRAAAWIAAAKTTPASATRRCRPEHGFCAPSAAFRPRNPLRWSGTAPFPPISPIGYREPPPRGWPLVPSARAASYAARPRSLSDASALNLAKDVVDRGARRKAVAGQTAPPVGCAQQIENGVHRRAHVGLARVSRPATGDASVLSGSSPAHAASQITRIPSPTGVLRP